MVLGEVGIVSTTPALVPTHSSSSHTSSAVIRRQAALCCRMMASEPVEGEGAELAPTWLAPACSVAGDQTLWVAWKQGRWVPASILCTGGVTSTSASCSKVSGW